MDLPSGRKFDDLDEDVLRQMQRSGFIKRDDTPKKLNSGIMSYVYVYGRNDLTEDPALMTLVGEKLCRVLDEARLVTDQRPCLIGIPTAGNALAIATAIASTGHGKSRGYIHARIMREVRKKHGDGTHQSWVDGKPELDRHTYWTVDNVITDGDTKIKADTKLIEDGYPPKSPCLILVDRQQGGVEHLKKEGFTRIAVAYNLLEITYAYGEWGLWPKDTVKAVKDEIVAHQFKS